MPALAARWPDWHARLAAFLAGYNRIRGSLARRAGATIVRLKNRITDENNHDFLINIRLASGFIVELQLHLAQTLEGKQGTPVKVRADRDKQGGFGRYTTHDAYDYLRILEGFFGAVARTTAANERKIVLPRRGGRPLKRQEMASKRNLALAQGDHSELAAIKADLKRPFVQDNLNTIYQELITLYKRIQAEIAGNAWSKVVDGHADDLEAIEGIDNINGVPEQDLGAIGQHWKADTDNEDLINAHYQKAARQAHKHVNAAPAGQRSMLATFKMYHGLLAEKHATKQAKKKGKKVPTWHAKVDTYLLIMARAIAILEADENRRLQQQPPPQQPQQAPQQQPPPPPQ